MDVADSPDKGRRCEEPDPRNGAQPDNDGIRVRERCQLRLHLLDAILEIADLS
jgi:hypothetical protein